MWRVVSRSLARAGAGAVNRAAARRGLLLRTAANGGVGHRAGVAAVPCRWHSHAAVADGADGKRAIPNDGKTLRDFVRGSSAAPAASSATQRIEPLPPPVVGAADPDAAVPAAPKKKSYYLETYGCQMNESDSEIVKSVLNGAQHERVDSPDSADVILVNTCAIRENAEDKVWQRLYDFRGIKRRRRRDNQPKVAVLGCMAERLKTKLIETDQLVDVVAGPDAYRDLPRLLAAVGDGDDSAVNVQLSIDETYADIAPVREDPNKVQAFLSIMRGCENMCAFCIVPYTRGRERSRSSDSIVDEVKQLSALGYKEVMLLGQNVNSYNDISGVKRVLSASRDAQTPGFVNISRRPETGVGFAELIERVAAVDPEMRVRFTSPHPKDFPPQLLQLIRDTPNICKSIHIPAQSGSSSVLERMRRGYTRHSYLQLVSAMRDTIPNVALSTDIITGFPGETEAEHAETVSLMRAVAYEQAFMFKYSQREKTYAHRHYADDVTDSVKGRRLTEVIAAFHEGLRLRHAEFVESVQLVLLDKLSRRSDDDFSGLTDSGKRVVFPRAAVPLRLTPDILRAATAAPATSTASSASASAASAAAASAAASATASSAACVGGKVLPKIGDYVAVRVTSVGGLAGSGTLKGHALALTTAREFHAVASSAPAHTQLRRLPSTHALLTAAAADAAAADVGRTPLRAGVRPPAVAVRAPAQANAADAVNVAAASMSSM